MILDEIVAKKRTDLEKGLFLRPPAELEREACTKTDIRDFYSALNPAKSGGLSIIAEVKRASPSKGLIAPSFDYTGIARAYETTGASAISVLTEEHYFQGKNAYLTEIKEQTTIPFCEKTLSSTNVRFRKAGHW
jgi:indole-3-glycerol phosphate synthase